MFPPKEAVSPQHLLRYNSVKIPPPRQAPLSILGPKLSQGIWLFPLNKPHVVFCFRLSR